MIVAELSANHNHNLQIARDSIRAIADTGADAVKLQTYLPESLTLDCRKDDFRLKGGLWDGRYLYDLEEGWVTVCENGRYYGKTKTEKQFRWNPPELPAWALPEEEKEAFQKADKAPETNTPYKAKKGKGSEKAGESIKDKGNAVISRIGDVMKHEENGNPVFTESEIDQVRRLVAGTQLTENGVKELEDLEKVVRTELDTRLSKQQAA